LTKGRHPHNNHAPETPVSSNSSGVIERRGDLDTGVWPLPDCVGGWCDEKSGCRQNVATMKPNEDYRDPHNNQAPEMPVSSNSSGVIERRGDLDTGIWPLPDCVCGTMKKSGCRQNVKNNESRPTYR
jgi:hypothetical protein